MPTFIHEFIVNTPIQPVIEFHKDARALKWLTPPPVYVQFHEIQPLGEGSRAEFTMWMGPIPIRWIAVHSDYDPQKGFTDSQVKGPFKYWEHKHSFISIDDNTTKIMDQVSAEPGSHWFWGLVSRFMWLTLPLLFTYRGWSTRRIIQKMVGK
jgi:ligand-binding SRPBCC domain-containing protein